MKYDFEIVFKRRFAFTNIHTLQFHSESNNIIEGLVSRCNNPENLVVFLKEFLSLIPEKHDDQEISNLSEDQLREEVQRLSSENSNLKSDRQRLEDQVTEINSINSINQYSKHYYDEAQKYKNLCKSWNQLFPSFHSLDDLANHIALLTTERDNLTAERNKLLRSKQASDKQARDFEKELQETQQKLSLATTRLRGINTHSDHAGGGSRSDQLKNEFSHLKTSLFHDASKKVLSGWRDQGSSLTVRSEEFFNIKSVLSQRVFGDGMAYFSKDKIAVNAELHLVMDALEGIKGFSPTTDIFQEIQEKVQVGLLRAKGVDRSDEAIGKSIEEITQRIDQELKLIANLETTSEALSEIKKFVESGLKIAREIVNDANSGELFIPENGTPFDENAHETRDDHQGQIKMTICAGYRIKGTVLVKADVMTYEIEATPPDSEQEPVNTQIPNPQNLQLEGESQGNNSPIIEKTEDEKKTTDLMVGQDQSVFVQPQSSDFAQDHLEGSHSDQTATELSKSFKTFKGKATRNLKFRHSPKKEDKAESEVASGEVLNFEGWVVGEPWKGEISASQQKNDRWYKVAGQNYWLPAFYIEIEGDLPTDLEIKATTGEKDEVQ